MRGCDHYSHCRRDDRWPCSVVATMLVVANRWLHVDEDPRIDAVEAMLPHTNCGACGYPGCHAFAEALVNGEALPVKCSVSNATQHARIASFLGVDVGVAEKACSPTGVRGWQQRGP